MPVLGRRIEPYRHWLRFLSPRRLDCWPCLCASPSASTWAGGWSRKPLSARLLATDLPVDANSVLEIMTLPWTTSAQRPVRRNRGRSSFLVRVQKFFTDSNLVIRMPESVPPIVVRIIPVARPVVFPRAHVLADSICCRRRHQRHRAARLLAIGVCINTLPGILVYAFLVTMLWSVGINGDNALDAIVAPIFCQYLAANVDATTAASRCPISPPTASLQHS